MTNVERRTRTIVHHEVLVPIRDGKVTRRDVAELLTFADLKYRELHPNDPHIKDQDLYDDAYYIEPRDDELVAVIPIVQ